MAESLLAHLYSRIKGSQEDVATVSLQYIISSSEKLNTAFNKTLSDALKIKLDEDITYSCQSVGENSERPDMSGIDKFGREVILCEMKFYAGLTSNQPNAYLDRLIKEDGKALVFVCPEQRRVSLWDKIKKLCLEHGKSISDEDGFRVSVDGIAMAILSWAEIIEILRRTASSVAVEALPDIAQLDGFCEMMDSSAFIPFSAEDLGPDVARREERYYQVIDRLFDSIIANKSINSSGKGLRGSSNRNGYIRYVKIGDYCVALMYDRTAWMSKKSVESPFWIYLTDDRDWKQSDSLKAKLMAVPENEKEVFGNYIGIALNVRTDAELDEVVADMMNQVLGYIERLRN